MENEIIEQGPEIMIKRRNIIWDSQMMSAWMACKRLADFQHHMHLVPITGKGHYLEMGSIVHAGLAELYRNKRDGIPYPTAVKRAIEEAHKYAAGDLTNEKKYPGVKNVSQEEMDIIFTTLN